MMKLFELKHPVVLFDGLCNLCDQTVQGIILADQKGIIHFASLQSKFAETILKDLDWNQDDLKSMILIENGKIYFKSTAVLRTTKHLAMPYKLGCVFLLVPPFIRDAVYELLAKNRYLWFGKKEECMIPTPDLKSRFYE